MTSSPHAQSLAGPGPEATPRLPLGFWGILIRVVLAIGLTIGANYLVLGISNLLALIPGLGQLLTESATAVYVELILLHVLMLTVVIVALWAWVRFIERERMRNIGWSWNRWSAVWLLLGVVVSAGLLLAARSVLPSTGEAPGLGALEGEAPAALTVVLILTQGFLLQGIPEELIFRGWLLSTMRSRPVVSVIVTTLSFTVIHLISQGGQQSFAERLLYLVLPLGIALLAVGLLLWTRSLWAAIGVHGGFHLGNNLASLLLPQAIDPTLIWIAVGTTQSVVGLVLVVTALLRGRGIPW